MKKHTLDIQLIISVITIAVTRALLLITWNSSLMKSQLIDSWHHMYMGVILVLLSSVFPMKNRYIIQGVGIGLFIDELIHIPHLLGFTKGNDYWSWQAWGALFFGIFIYILVILWMNKMTKIIAKKEVL